MSEQPRRDLLPSTLALIAKVEAQVARYPDEVVTVIPGDGDYDHRLTMVGLLSCQVCTRLSAAEAAWWLSLVRPPGTRADLWVPAEDVAEVACEQFPQTHRHVIVEC